MLNTSESELILLNVAGTPLTAERLTGSLSVSRLFEFEVTALGDDAFAAPKDLLGKDCRLELRTQLGDALVVHGVVVEASVNATLQGVGYLLRIAPGLAPLTVGADCRVFQELTVRGIVDQVIELAGFPPEVVRWELSQEHAKRVYTAQYCESDWAFVERLLAEEGIYYWFEFGEEQTTLVLSDDSSGAPPIAGEKTLPYRDRSMLLAASDSVSRLSARSLLASDLVSLADYDWETPQLELTGNAGGGAHGLEVYDYPGNFNDDVSNQDLATLLLQRLRAEERVVQGDYGNLRLQPGLVFEIEGAPQATFDTEYFCTAVELRARQGLTLVEADPQDHQGLRVTFTAIPRSIPFRPAFERSVEPDTGPQTGRSCGPSGDEIYTNDRGQVRVQFYWDRVGKKDENASTYMRVGQIPLGGSMVLPRIGWDLWVTQQEGDADDPVIASHLYDGENTVPYALPDNKARTAWQTNTTPGDGTSSEIRFDDTAGSEEMYLHAARDMAIAIGNDRTENVGANHVHEIGINAAVDVGKNRKLGITADQSVSVGAVETLTVQGSRSTAIDGSETAVIGAVRMHSVTAGRTLDAEGGRTLTVGGAIIASAAKGISRDVGGACSVTVGGAWISAAALGVDAAVAGASAETVGGALIRASGASVEVTSGKAMTSTVGGACINAGGKNVGCSGGGNVSLTVGGAFVGAAPDIEIEGKNKIVLKVGGSSLTITKSSIELKSSAIAAPGGMIAKQGGTIKHN